MQTEAHPSRFELESLHVGDRAAPGVADHVAGCAACASYLTTLAEEAVQFAASARPAAFIAAVEAKADARRARRWLGHFAPVALAAIPILAFALLPTGGVGVRIAAQLDEVLVKGNAAPVEVALVRESGGQQTRLHGPVDARPGDRFAVELRISRPVELAVVVADGATVVPIARAAYAAGVHHLPGFELDQQPGELRVLVGPPAEVERALAGGSRRGVVSVAVRSAGAR